MPALRRHGFFVEVGPGAMRDRLRPHLAPAAALLALVLLFLVLYRLRQSPAPVLPPAPPVSAASRLVRFTTPGAAEALALRGGPDAAVAQSIDAAERSVDMAMYELNLWSIRDALLRADERGVGVRLVMERDNMGAPEVEALTAAGIPVVGDTDEGLMHDKFVVIDGAVVWTGSMNLTVSDAYYNDNNLIRLDDPDLASAYTAEFDEMFTDGRFGPLSPRGSGVHTADGRVEVAFSPDDGVAARLLALLPTATTSLEVMAFSFTSDDLADALLERAAAGVRVRVVLDEDQARNLGSVYGRLRDAGLDVRLDGSPDKMHNKVMILDGETVVTGSYNFSRSAEVFNDENLVILYDPEIAGAFEDEFERIFEAGK
ncbi:MAG TPA: phospholipase D-like domain-containing protein [Anaerolineales bacterium]|nr:phospholipase D-like domain-containing protein [Anaerolineales bacterium]